MSDKIKMFMKDCTQELADFYSLAAMGDADGVTFLLAWHLYCHEVDDLIDQPEKTSEPLLAVLSHAIDVYSHPFYQRHLIHLRPVAKLITDTYAQSVVYEPASEEWKRAAADVLRHSGCEMCYAVAELMGGWEHRRTVRNRLSETVYQDRNEPRVKNTLKD